MAQKAAARAVQHKEQPRDEHARGSVLGRVSEALASQESVAAVRDALKSWLPRPSTSREAPTHGVLRYAMSE